MLRLGVFRLAGGGLASIVGSLALVCLLAPTPALAACQPYNLTFTTTGLAAAQDIQTYQSCDGAGLGLFRNASDNVNGTTAVGAFGYEAVTSSKGNIYYFLWNNAQGSGDFGYDIYLGTQVANGPDTITLYAASASSSGPVDTTVTFNFAIPSLGPVVTSVGPTAGPLGGGTTVTITGSGFSAAAATGAVHFGSTVATYTVNSDTRITATSPAHASAQVDVTVTAGGVTSSTVAGDKFTYTTAPTASSFTASAAAYNTGSASATTIDVTGHVTNSPTGYAVGSSTTAQGGSVSINSSGLASYTPPVGFRGNDSFTYTATNSGGTSSPATVTVPVNNPTITVTPTTMITGSYGVAYSQSLTASGGKAPYTFSTTLASGSLPAGLMLSSSGTISGTPTAAGTFTFTVTGTDSSTGTGPATFTSGTISLTVNAAVPGAPTISAVTGGNGQATVAFTPPGLNGGAAITSYTVTSSPGGFTATGTGSPLTVTGLTNGTAYTFTVKATNSVGTGTASSASASVTPSTVPGAPTIGSVIAGNGQAMVAFATPASNGGAAITSYTVTSSPGGFTASGGSSPIAVTGLTNGTSYTFTVTATNANGTGSASSASSAVTPATVPGAPTIGAVTAGNGQALVSFSAPASNGGAAITSYTVTSSPGGLTMTGSASPIVVAGLANGTAYTFTVTATNSVGTGVASSASGAVTPSTVPGAPTIGSVTGGNGQATVAFATPASNGGAAITGYTVTSNPGGFTASGVGSPLTVTGLTNGTSYTFTVTATNANGTGSASSASNSVTPATVPDAPTIGSVTAGNGQALVAFSAPASNGGAAITSYTVTSSPGGLTGTGSASPILMSGLTNGTAYTFTVTATNSAGTGVASSASSAVMPSTVPGAPTIGSVTPGNEQATVAFAPPASNGGAAIISYTVTSSPGGFTASGSGSPITVTGLTNGTSYTFTVTATNANGPGSASPASSAVTPSTVPGVPMISTVTAGNAQTTVAFTAPSATGGAAITSYTVTSSPGGLTATGSGSPITITGLTNGTAYTFTVTATNVDGAGAASPASAAVTPSTVPGAPTIGSVTAGNGQAIVSFTAPASNGGATITGYTVTSSPGGFTASGSGSPLTVTGLTNGTSYTFTVTATNANGTGAASAASSSVTPATVPGAPTIDSVTAGDGQALVAFTAPASNGGAAITSYTVTSSPGGFTATGSSSPITVSGLTDGTAYTFTVTATNANGTGAASPASSAVTPSTVPGAPTIGTVTAGNGQATVSFTAPASNGGAAITSYTVTSSPGGLTASGSSSPITITGLTNGTVYSFKVAATNASGTGASSASSNSVTPLAPPTAGPASLTVAANSGANPVTLGLGGGAASSVAVVSPASHGTATASGTSITYTPTAGYSGSDSFTYTATNSSGTSAPATVTITVSAPTFAFTPAAGALSAGTVNTAYSQTVTAAGGSAPYSYSIAAGALPAGLSLNASTGSVTGTPTADGTFNFTIKATDANNAMGTAAYSIAIGVQAPVANAVAAAVAANSSTNAITLNITGGAAASVAVASNPTHGTAAASGTSITYTPTAGYSGSDSFTYTATNATGTSAPATVTITVSAPTFAFTPAAGALSAGTVNTAYSQTVTAVGGSAPYSYSIAAGALPAGLTLNTSTGSVAGTPTAAGTFNFTIKATDANNATGSASYSIAVKAAAAFVFTPPSGALKNAMVGEDYSQSISAKGGSGALIYSLASGALPKGMILNISTGELAGPLSPDAEAKDYIFTIQVRDQSGAVGMASYSLTVKARSVTVTNQTETVAAGATPNNVDLTRGATGGPFISADLVSVEPPNAGTVSIVRGEFAQASAPTQLGWYLKFIPNPAYSGQVRVRFSLTSALGVSNIGTVTYTVAYDAAKVATEIDGLVRDFVKARQSLIASTIKVPGLLERRQMVNATDPVTARMMPSEEGMTVNFSTSLAQMRSARDSADGVTGGYVSPFNIWIDGAFLAHNEKDTNGGKWGSFAMLNMGVDYLLSEKALLGLSFHYDRMTDPTDADAELTGNGWLAGPYASFEVGKNVFWNASVLYGGSSNDINTQFWDGTFDTRRFLADTSVEGQWDLNGDTVLRPKLRVFYFTEDVKDYSVKNSADDTIAIDGFNEEQLRVSLGTEIARSFTLDNGTKLTPKLGLTGGFSGLDGSGAFGSVTAGISMQTADSWMLDTSLLFDIEGEGEKSVGAKVAVSKHF